MIFGIESTYPSNGKLTNGYRLFDWVMRKQDVPRFWLRGITGEYGVTREEMAFLKSERMQDRFGSERPYGADRIAKRSRAGSAARARSLATAAGTLVFGDCAFCALCAELEHEPQLGWLSFAYTLCENGYIPGFIGNTDSSKRFRFDRECGHYKHASEADSRFGALFGATEPESDAPRKAGHRFVPPTLRRAICRFGRRRP